jgi:hypothetical protein
MAIRTAALNLLTFPQRWDAQSRRLKLRFLCFPRIDPDIPLAPAHPAFADAAMAFEARIIPSLARLPRGVDVSMVSGGAVPGSPLDVRSPPAAKADAFEALRTLLNIQPRSPGIPVVPRTARRILKPETASWRALVGNRRSSRFLIDKDAVACALHEALDAQPKEPQQPPAILRWGEAMALALRTQPLAEALGLIGEVSVAVPDGLLANGGWIFLGLHASSAYASDASLVNLQAALIPPLDDSRTIYAATLFPVDQDDFAADDAIAEAINYADGFAGLVHATQSFEDREQEKDDGQGDGDCVRLAWDDEQVAEWLNRQSDPDAGTPMGTIGYRVDVRDLTDGGPWQSLQLVESIGNLTLGAFDLGSWQGERAVEVVPARRKPKPASDFWLPAYFATWRGSSLVLSDPDFVRLQRAASPPERADLNAFLLDREKVFAPVEHAAVPLRYGHRYAFRVRMADLTHGGPPPGAGLPDPGFGRKGLTAELLFQRRRRPGAVKVMALPTPADPTLVVRRPTLRFPELRFAGDALLDTDADAILEGKPDPDVTGLRIRLDVRALAGDRVEWQQLYELSRDFPTGDVSIAVNVVDVPRLDAFADPNPAEPLPIPAQRDLRLVLTALGRPDDGYFANDIARESLPAIIPLKATARAEGPLIALADESLVSFYFRTPGPEEVAPGPLDLLARSLGLPNDGLTVTGSAGRRTVLACGTALRHTPSPERHALLFSSDADLRQRWINVLTFDLERDWSWRGLAETGLTIERAVGPVDAAGSWQSVGTVRIPNSVVQAALPATAGARDAQRQSCRVIFFDSVSPLEIAGPNDFPAEIELAYRIAAPFPAEVAAAPNAVRIATRLPIVTPPRQTPKLVSAGIALAPFVMADDYSSTAERRRQLWLEFESPPADPGDAYFARILAVAPDPLLVGVDAAIPKVVEPPLPLDSEWMRRIIPGQPRDASGRFAMPTRLAGGLDGRHVLVPLPDGLDAESLELTGMFTYEFRVGHADERWCTAHGRWGPSLRLTGMQHPPPPLSCEAALSRQGEARGVLVAAPFAIPVLNGRPIQPRQPRTRLWALLYARVSQADGKSFRNLLILRQEMRPDDRLDLLWTLVENALKGVAFFPQDEITDALTERGLPPELPLTVLAAEFFADPEVVRPVESELGEARLMRASNLVPVSSEC